MVRTVNAFQEQRLLRYQLSEQPPGLHKAVADLANAAAEADIGASLRATEKRRGTLQSRVMRRHSASAVRVYRVKR